jgi:hypothetical protein
MAKRQHDQQAKVRMNEAVVDTLSGMYFTVAEDDGTFAAGQVIRLASDGVYFVRFEGEEVMLPLELVSVGEMLQSTEEFKIWRFFDTVEERSKWIEWLEKPEKARILTLVRPTTPKSEPSMPE